MTNLEKWRHYLDGIVSPDCYIDFGFYYLISSALQRRVYCGPEHFPCFANIYVILTGEPAVGKGLVIKPVAEVLKYHKLPDPREKLIHTSTNQTEKVIAESLQNSDYKAAVENEGGDKDSKAKDKPLMLPVAADATTYEALVRQMSRSFRSIPSKKWSDELGKEVPDIYSHSSLCFCLEEISSLFRKHTEDLVHFLIQAYDCGDYTYETKTKGKDKIRKCCLNFLGGTTPHFMNQSFNDSLINEGFSSRAFFIFAAKNRKRPFWIPTLTDLQKQCWKDVVEHVGKLIKLVGQCKFTPEANALLESWWEKAEVERPNTNPKLGPYYGRKKVHVLKMSMAIHFGESTDMLIGKESVEKALQVLATEEKKMHLCLGLDSANPLSKLANKVHHFLAYNPSKEYDFKSLLAAMWEYIPTVDDKKESLSDVLDYLETNNKILILKKLHPITKMDAIFYTASTKQSET